MSSCCAKHTDVQAAVCGITQECVATQTQHLSPTWTLLSPRRLSNRGSDPCAACGFPFRRHPRRSLCRERCMDQSRHLRCILLAASGQKHIVMQSIGRQLRRGPDRLQLSAQLGGSRACGLYKPLKHSLMQAQLRWQRLTCKLARLQLQPSAHDGTAPAGLQHRRGRSLHWLSGR